MGEVTACVPQRHDAEFSACCSVRVQNSTSDINYSPCNSLLTQHVQDDDPSCCVVSFGVS